MFRRSASGVGRGRAAGRLSTGSDSPVSAASFVRSAAASRRRASAATRSPASSRRRSPRTTSAAGTTTACPSRTTRARGAVRRASAATARSARCSCTNPISAFRTTMARMAAPSTIRRPRRDGRRADQHPDDDAAELTDQDVEWPELPSRADRVRAVDGEPPARLVRAEPRGQVARKRAEHLVDRSGMPGAGHAPAGSMQPANSSQRLVARWPVRSHRWETALPAASRMAGDEAAAAPSGPLRLLVRLCLDPGLFVEKLGQLEDVAALLQDRIDRERVPRQLDLAVGSLPGRGTASSHRPATGGRSPWRLPAYGGCGEGGSWPWPAPPAQLASEWASCGRRRSAH